MLVEVHLIGLAGQAESRVRVKLAVVVPLHIHGVANRKIDGREGGHFVHFLFRQFITLPIGKEINRPFGDDSGMLSKVSFFILFILIKRYIVSAWYRSPLPRCLILP